MMLVPGHISVGMPPGIGRATRRRLLLAILLVSLGGCQASEQGEPLPRSSPRGLEAGLDSVRTLIAAGDYSAAETIARPLLQQAEKAHGRESLATARVLDQLLVARRRGGKGNDPETLELAERAVRIKEALSPPAPRELAQSLHGLAILHHSCARFAEAEPLYGRALELRRETDGPDHPDYARVLVHLASLLADTGRSPEARARFAEARTIFESSLPPDHFDIADCLGKEANLLTVAGQYAAAKPLYERALTIGRKALSDEHPRVAGITYNYCHLLRLLGDIGAAIECLETALANQVKLLGAEHPNVALSIGSIGKVKSESGDYAGAMPHFERALEIYRKNGDETHPNALAIRDAAAFMLHRTGDYERAEEMLRHSLAIRVKLFGERHQAVAYNHFALGSLYLDMQRFADARARYERALGLFTRSQGAESPWVAWTLLDMAILETLTGDPSAARLHFERALEIHEEAKGPDTPSVAWCLYHFASFLVGVGEQAAAESLLTRAAAIFEEADGCEHQLAIVLSGRAHCLARLGDDEQALREALRAEEIGSDHLRRTAPVLAERQAFLYAGARASGHDLAFSLLVRGFRDRPAALRSVWNRLIRSRALVLEEMAARHHAAIGAGDAQLERMADSLSTIRRRLATLTLRGPADEDPGRYRQRLDEAERQKESLERILSRKSLIWRTTQDDPEVDLGELQRRMPPGSALVAFVLYRQLLGEPSGRPARRDMPRAPVSHLVLADAVPAYLALVQAGAGQPPALVPLGEAAAIDSLVLRWREELSPRKLADLRSPEEAEADYRQVGLALRRAIWDPIAAHLADVDRIFVVPDGPLNLVSLATLPTGEAGYLADDGPLIHYLSAERDLSGFAEASAMGRGLLAVGAVDFDARTADPAAREALIGDHRLSGAATRGAGLGCLEDLTTLTFEPLPETRLEAELVGDLWRQAAGPASAGPVSILTGDRATEGAFTSLVPRKRILHLATHGFFLQGHCPGATSGLRGIGGLAARPPEDGETPIRAAPEDLLSANPMLLSGLVLAGANRPHPAPGEEDGILTAEEIATLPLGGVEWAVLSACDTGVGEIRAGEGVLGLRRAFRIGGVRTVIMSLWSVDDQVTREWMTSLYRARLVDGLSTDESVRRANREFLTSRRRSKLSTHPFYWGGFVAAGDWR